MKATLFKNLTNKPSEIEIQAGKSIKESLPNINFKNALIYANNRQQTPEYVAQESDLVIIRMIPAEDYDPWDWVFTIATGGLYSIGKMAYDNYQARKKAEEEIEKMKKLSNRPDIDNRPFLRGASNTVATGNSQPYIIGRHFFTPYLLSKPFYQIVGTDGADEYTYTALECGFNKQILQSVAIDDIKIKTFSDNTPQEGAYNIDAGIFAEDGKLEIAQDGANLTEIPELNYKVESTSCNDNIPRDSEVSAGTEVNLTYTLNKYAKDVDIAITFPNGLFAYNEKNNKVNTSVTITPQYSLDGGANWNSFTFNNNGTATNTFNRNVSTKEMRFVAHKDFSKADYDTLASNNQEAIMIRLTNNGSKDSKITNACYCIFYQSVCFDPDKSTSELVPCKIVEDRERAFCTVLGLKLKATKINEDKLKKINIITHGIARTWDGTEWSTAKTATRNPAAWALEILTSDSHPASKFRDSEIDLDSFGDYYEYCENPENDAAANHFSYHFDWVITQNTKKQDTLNHILNATNARIYQDITGKLAVAIDRPQENAVAVYNPQNIIDIKNKKTTSRVSDGMRIKYTDSKNDLFQESTYLVMREGRTLNENSIIKDLSVTGITEHEHIVRYARRLMAIETLRPKTTTLDIGNEGLFYIPYSKVLVQDDSLKIGIGKGFTIHDCTWQSGLLKKIYTNEPLTFDPAKTYGIIVNCFTADDVKPVAIKVEGTGTTHELTVISAIRASADAIPESGNVFSFGELDENGEFTKVTTEYIISNITRGDNGFKLELVNYNEAIYDSGTIPEYKSNITKKATAEKKGIPADAVTHEELLETVATVDGTKAAQEAANEVVHGIHFTNVHRIRDMELSLEEVIAKMDDDRQSLSASISISEDEILLRVDDMERELVGLIDVQAGAVTALVEGGGATGQMSLSLELPVMIDATTRAQFVQASTEAKVAAVYAQLEGTSGAGIRYAIKGNASNAAVKALWDDAVAGALIASQIDLSATQIHINAQNVQIDGETIISNAKKIKAALIEVDELLSQNITLKQSGYIKSSNYAESDGYPTAGFMLDCANNIIKAYQLQAVGGVFKEGIFEGLVQCGVFNVTKRTIQTNILYYNTDQKSDFESYYNGTWGLEYSYTGSVAALYGDNSYIRIGENRYRNIDIHIYNKRAIDISFYAYNDVNNKILIYEAYGSVALESDMYYPYWIEYYQENALIAEFANLPTFDPHILGIVWNQDGSLKVSAG